MLKIVFVCLGNICRSPSAEAVMNKMIADEGLSEKIKCDSAGTIGYHAGEQADARMQRHAERRGYDLTSISRKFVEKDFSDFHYIVTMDDDNYRDIKALDYNGRFGNKIFRMVQFSSDKNVREVPDPYYGGPQGFENVLNILEDCCSNFLKYLKGKHSL